MALKADQPIRWWRRVGVWVLGLTVNKVMEYGYNFGVYPKLIGHYGLTLGWTLAVIGSILLCLGTLWFYDVTKTDWIILETAKQMRDDPAVGRFRKFFKQIANRGDWIAFMFLSTVKDAFITTVYMRRGSGNYTMTNRDWKIFWASIAVSNLWWGLAVFGVLKALQEWFPGVAVLFE